MEICIHAGLHKSGTTTVQHAFAATFGQMGRVWYPVLGHPEAVNHAPLVWPYLLGVQDDPHFDAVVHQRLGGPATLEAAITEASANGVEKLVISSESLAILTDYDVEGLRRAFLGHPVRVLFTVTSPLHRWASTWQELVRHGFGAAPIPAEALLVEISGMKPGQLAGLIGRFPADHKHVRIVSRESIDTRLVQSAADIFGLGPVEEASKPLNESLSDDSVLIAYLNSRGRTNGALSHNDRQLIEETKREIGSRRIDDFSADDFALPDGVIATAEAERRYLASASESGEVRVHDPAGALSRWATVGLPAWYIRARDGSTGSGGLLRDPEIIDAHWRRARRVFSAEAALGTAGVIEGQIRAQLSEVSGELKSTRERLDVTGETLRSTRQELRAIQRSRTWRWATAAAQVAAPFLRVLRLHK